MNQFRTSGRFSKVILVLGFLFCLSSYQNLSAYQQEGNDNGSPRFEEGGYLYADIDTKGQRVLIAMNDQLWQYNLQNNHWRNLLSLQTINEPISNLEFGYNQYTGKVNLWSRGVGRMYEVNLESGEIRRVDQSFDHKNQFDHIPFYRDSTVYAFGGYGFWRWENIITFYHSSLREWMLQNVDMDGPMPAGRNAYTGEYVEENDELYIYGGNTPVNVHPDDKNVKMQSKNDIWKFSFRTRRWEKQHSLEPEDWKFYEAVSNDKISRINSISSSFYSSVSNIWYIPVTNSSINYNTFFLKPIDIRSNTVFPKIEFDNGGYADQLPTNFLFDDKNNRMILVGIVKLTEADSAAVNIVKIPEEKLLAKIPSSTWWVSDVLYYMFGGVLLLTLFGYYVVSRNNFKPRRKSTGKESISFSEVLSHETFSDQEKVLLQYLADKEQYLETQSIEEKLWGEVESYDYRRRLRNDIIKSINDKFCSHYDTDKKLIIREKDPEDKRRYLYGLNEDALHRES